MNPAVLAGIIQAGGSLLGGTLSSIGQGATNRANERIAQQQNALNYKMFQEQNRFNLEQWQRNNAYNTPLAQRRRYEQAGINPALALGNISAGTAQAVKSATPSPAVGATMANSMQGIGDGVTNAVNNAVNGYLTQRQNEAQVRLIESQREYQDLKNKDFAREKNLEQATGESAIALNQSLIDNYKTLLPLQKQQLEQNIKESVSRTELNNVQKSIQEYDLKHLKPSQQKELIAKISEAYARMKYLAVNGRLAESQIQEIGSRVILNTLQSEGVRITNEKLPSKLQAEIEGIKASARNSDANAKNTNKRTEYMPQDQAMKWIESTTKVSNSGAQWVDAFVPG